MINSQIIVKIKEVYGQRTVYPVCATAQKLAELAGTKTLTHAALQKIESLGFVIAVEQQTL